MEQTKQKPLAVKAMEYLKGAHPRVNEERFSLFLALCQLCEDDSKKALGILLADQPIVTNIRKASTWVEVYQEALSFADQLATTYLPGADGEKEMEMAERHLGELNKLNPEQFQAYFADTYGCYLFPELNISFCIKKELVSLLRLPYPGEYQVQ